MRVVRKGATSLGGIMSKEKFFAGYLHPNWQRKRLEVMSKKRFSCEACGATDSPLHVHHKVYENGKSVHEAKSSDLEVLCRECHARVEAMVKGVRRLGGLMIMASAQFGNAETPLECMIRTLEYDDGGTDYIERIKFHEKTYNNFIETAFKVVEDNPELQDGV